MHGAGLCEFDLLVLADDFIRQGSFRFVGKDGKVI